MLNPALTALAVVALVALVESAFVELGSAGWAHPRTTPQAA